MKKLDKNLIATAVVVSLAFGLAGPIAALAAGPAAVNLGSAGNFVILAKTGISTTGATSIVGNLGVSPVAASYITGFGLTMDVSNAFSTSALVTGKAYAADYTAPTPTTMTTAVSDMQTAYTDAVGRTNPTATELGAGNIGGMTLAPGLYKWGTGVTIPTDVTLSGGANDVWIFQVAQNLDISSAAKIVLAGGAQPANIFWQVAGQTTLGTTAVFNGNILDQTAIVLSTGATLNGRALAQTAVTLDANMVTAPAYTAPTPIVNPSPTSTPVVATSTAASTSTSTYGYAACTQDTMRCSDGSLVGRIGPSCTFAACPTANATTNTSAVTTNTVQTQTPPASPDNVALQVQLNGLLITLHSLQVQAGQQGSPAVSVSSQPVRTIAVNLGKGNSGNNVAILQQFLISQNKGPAAQALANVGATAYFGALTRAALAEFQKSAGISPALGNFGTITQTYVSAHY